MKPKVGEVWRDYTQPGVCRICTITNVYRNGRGSWSVTFRFDIQDEDERDRDWLLEDFLKDAVLCEECMVDKILTKYTNQ